MDTGYGRLGHLVRILSCATIDRIRDGDQGAERGEGKDDGGVGDGHLDAAVALGEAVGARGNPWRASPPLK